MIIDWYTVLFQIINFLVLVFLLRRFLYGPIVRAMEERERKIVAREEDAATRARESEEEARTYRQKMAELEERDRELLDQARSEAEKEGQRLLKETRSQVEETRRRWQREVAREKEVFLRELRSRMGRQACLIARRCLKDLADAELETMIWNVFLRKLKALSPEESGPLQEAFSQEKQVLLSSSFEPAAKRLEETAASLEEIFAQKVQLTHQKDAGLVCGVELEVGGYRVAWSVEEYLEDVEKEILAHLEQSEKEALPDAEAG